MLTSAEKIVFILLALGSFYYGGTKFYGVYRAIARGKPDSRFDNLTARIGQAIWIVLTQQSVFKARPIVSFLHALVFYGFVFYFLVNLVDVLEGFLAFTRAAESGTCSTSSATFSPRAYWSASSAW
jgi:hypothetical protein